MENCRKIVYQGGTGEYEEKKSRFIAAVRPVENEGQAQAFIEEMKKKYWDARHHCYAYITGDTPEIVRSSDDGEPAGTAGRPILEVLSGEELHNTAIVVTRYFGGTLLGTGGLVRAYTKASKDALEHSTIIEKKKGILMDVLTDYTGFGKIQYVLAQQQIPTMDIQYTEKVLLKILVSPECLGKIYALLDEATGGQTQAEEREQVDFAIIGNKAVLL